MGERGHTYDDVIGTATERFHAAVGTARLAVTEAGGRLLSTTTLTACMLEAIKETVEGLSDIALLSAAMTRPDILHAGPGLYGELPTPRKSMDHAFKAQAYRDLSEIRLASVADGQDEDTLPDAARAALVALSEVEASGRRFRLADDAREALTSGDWDDDLVHGCGMPLAEFLAGNGRPDAGNDLRAAIEAREAVMASSGAPGMR